MGDYITVTWGTTDKKCVTCGIILTVGFPDGFPDEWKFCCYCLLFAKEISNGHRKNIENFYGGRDLGDRLKILLDKIEKHINLV